MFYICKMKKGINDFFVYDASPYIEVKGLFKHPKGKRYKQERGLSKSGVEEYYTKEYEFPYGDNSHFTKLFMGNHERLGGLSNAGMRLFFYICDKLLRPNQWEIELSHKQAMKALGYKTNKSIIDGVIDLLEKDILSRKLGTSSGFFINPNVLFRGDRRVVYFENAAGFQKHIELLNNTNKSNSVSMEPNNNFENE